ncbi:MAG: hypothetical protein A4E55_02279 [Pelotomaculum sp. PtaU1.Bin035]|nr:MAG: hypothetical protein A4E55_02279 [Pelotomaculum sp. PtaU1.Bin035]
MSLLARLEKQKTYQTERNEKQEKNLAPAKKDPYEQLKITIHKKIIEELKDLATDNDNSPEAFSSKIEETVLGILENEGEHIPRLDRMRIAKEICDDAIAFGPITPLLNDPEITEVMVNGPDKVYVEKKGKIELTEVFFRNNSHIMHVY